MDLLDNFIAKIKGIFALSSEQSKNDDGEKKITKFNNPKEDEDEDSSNGKKPS